MGHQRSVLQRRESLIGALVWIYWHQELEMEGARSATGSAGTSREVVSTRPPGARNTDQVVLAYQSTHFSIGRSGTGAQFTSPCSWARGRSGDSVFGNCVL